MTSFNPCMGWKELESPRPGWAGIFRTTAGNSVGAGTLVGGPQMLPMTTGYVFFGSNALIALARSLCKCLLAVLITASGADTVKGYLVRCACIDDTIP